jgi:hypothetical protein
MDSELSPEQRQSLLRCTGVPKHLRQEETGHRQIVVGPRIGLFTHRPCALKQLLRALKRLAQARIGKVLLDTGPLRLEARVIPRRAQRRRCGIAHLSYAFEQTRLVGKSQ